MAQLLVGQREHIPIEPSLKPNFTPRRHRTPVGPVTIDLLRHLNPDAPALSDDASFDHDDWYHHSRQDSDFVLVATGALDGDRQVLGTLELHLRDEEDDDGKRSCRGMIDRVFVLPEWRRLGIATQLVRGAIGFARDNGVVALREFIPSIFVRAGDTEEGRWRRYDPAVHELGGSRSLGATAKACTSEAQACVVVGAVHDADQHGGSEGDRCERIGGILELPIDPCYPRGPDEGRQACPMSHDALLKQLQIAIARLAGVRWPPAGVRTKA